MSHFSLVSLPAAPEDTHEESVRHTVVSTFSLKKKKMVWLNPNQAAKSETCWQRWTLLAEGSLFSSV